MPDRVEIHAKISPEGRDALTRGFTEEDGVAMIQAIDDGIIRDADNYGKVWKAQGPWWRPLNPRYQRRKVREGFRPEIWTRRGETLRSLTTTAVIRGGGGRAGSREVVMLENGGGKASAKWRMVAPAAGGYFAQNNRLRTFLQLISPGAIAAAEKRVFQVCIRLLERAGFRRVR